MSNVVILHEHSGLGRNDMTDQKILMANGRNTVSFLFHQYEVAPGPVGSGLWYSTGRIDS